MADLDSQLLDRPTLGRQEEAKAEKEIDRGKRRKSKEKQDSQKKERSGDVKQRPETRKRGGKTREMTTEKAKTAALNPVNKATKRILRWAWWTLIPSWGLTMLYIDMHVFMSMVIPDFFCKPGEEWEASAYSGFGGAHFTDKIKYPEWMAIIMSNLIMAAAFFVIFSALYYLVYAMKHPISFTLEAIMAVLKSLL